MHFNVLSRTRKSLCCAHIDAVLDLSPFAAADVLVVDPITNSSSLIPLTRNTGHLKFEGVAYAASVDKIYFAP